MDMVQNPAAWKGSPGCDGLMEEQEKELEVATRDMIDESTGLPEEKIPFLHKYIFM